MFAQEAQRQRKRGRDQIASEDCSTLVRTKRQKRGSDNYPPAVWDNLSKITLTRKALREFDRRTRAHRHPQAARGQKTTRRILRSDARRLPDFASNGGPDLSPLRGYAELPVANAAMNKRQHDSGLGESSSTGRTGKTGTTGPYNAQFQQLLIDQGVYPHGYRTLSGAKPPKPQNMEETYRRLSQPRPSLSPSRFSEGAFEDFQDQNGAASSEQDVMTDVIPTIRGSTGIGFHKAGNTVFNNLVKFAPGIADAKPDSYDGARPVEIDLAVRRDLNGYIIPSTSNELPAAPNHLTEVKGPSGRADVLRQEAMYAGAIGARAMHELQNYGNDQPVYDGNAYTLVPTYHAEGGLLRMYATHPTQSATGRTEYHMTEVNSYAMIGNANSFREGATAFRNSRDLSKEHSDRFIAAANAAAAQRPAPVATPSSGTASGSPISSRTGMASFESNTITEGSPLEAEEPPKRLRTRSAATPNMTESMQGRRRQALQQGPQSGSSPVSLPSSSNNDAGYIWHGYVFRRLRGGNYEFECTTHGKPQTMRARWAPGQTYPEVCSQKAKVWVQSSLDGQTLRIFVRGVWITLGKEAQ
ncbi:hypothetical protein LTR48_005772 [Friedmanniomyces endolithicus]|uniref:Uncharacterized protein n=1 Tax=Rachicladosporium monterosium TaxID=1507873 RepID=A0ABR0L121_9PEZI|nr:hypothetical protein LTR48_005772 [Friedmanniomyces endolithicus]KAK5141846.1 hypothetical protein LTR32_005686 [Rachicladosporium monterosium]